MRSELLLNQASAHSKHCVADRFVLPVGGDGNADLACCRVWKSNHTNLTLLFRSDYCNIRIAEPRIHVNHFEAIIDDAACCAADVVVVCIIPVGSTVAFLGINDSDITVFAAVGAALQYKMTCIDLRRSYPAQVYF